MAENRDLDWCHWLNRLAVEPWEAVALSLRIDPDKMFDDRKDFLVGPGTSAMNGNQPSQEKIRALLTFQVRLRRITRDISDQKIAVENNGKLRVRAFLAWLRETDPGDIPFELAMLDPTPEEQSIWDNNSVWLKENDPQLSRRFPNQFPQSAKSLATPESTGRNGDIETLSATASPSERRDVLAPAIDKAIATAGRHEFSAVYDALRNMALNSQSPFTGEVKRDGSVREHGALVYTDTKNQVRILSRGALSKRLKNRQKKIPRPPLTAPDGP